MLLPGLTAPDLCHTKSQGIIEGNSFPTEPSCELDSLLTYLLFKNNFLDIDVSMYLSYSWDHRENISLFPGTNVQFLFEAS